VRLTGSLADEEALALTSGWVMGYSPEYAACWRNRPRLSLTLCGEKGALVTYGPICWGWRRFCFPLT